jgi:hypothetical protein
VRGPVRISRRETAFAAGFAGGYHPATQPRRSRDTLRGTTVATFSSAWKLGPGTHTTMQRRTRHVTGSIAPGSTAPASPPTLADRCS